MSRARAATLALLLAGITGATGCARFLYNHGTVEAGRIYRSAQPSPLLLRWMLGGEPGLRTLVNLRGRTPGFESAFAAEHGLRLYSFDFSASRPPPAGEVTRLLEVLNDPDNHPLLVHCRNGVDRTGYAVGLYRLQHGWTADRALAEMRRYLQFETLNSTPAKVVRDDLRAPTPGE